MLITNHFLILGIEAPGKKLMEKKSISFHVTLKKMKSSELDSGPGSSRGEGVGGASNLGGLNGTQERADFHPLLGEEPGCQAPVSIAAETPRPDTGLRSQRRAAALGRVRGRRGLWHTG